MKNQYSFRLTTTLLPSDTSAKTTQVINKVDSNGNKFYPNFTEETVVITNDDRTIMETTRATCTDGVLTFVKRGLSDDDTETQIDNRKLTWNPGSLCFITAGASDWIDRDDDMSWQGDQTYLGKATYKGRLITEKGVEYPHFDSLEELQAYGTPFGGMFAVVDSDGELYRYNAENEEWSVVTTSTPVQPAKASEEAIGTVRVATDEEFEDGTDTGESGEYLMPTVSQVKANIPENSLHITRVNQSTSDVQSKGSTASITYEIPKDGFVVIGWQEFYANGHCLNWYSLSSTGGDSVFTGDDFIDYSSAPSGTIIMNRRNLVAVKAGTLTLTIGVYDESSNPSMPYATSAKIRDYFYFG